MRIAATLLLIGTVLAQAELVDRIAVVVGKSIIKDSDIDRDLRVREFLDNEPLRADAAERKKAARKLIEQVFLREEIRTGAYPAASDQEVNAQLNTLKNARFSTESAFQATLAKYDIVERELRVQLRWQLTVLHFIDERFKPAANVQDAAVTDYVRRNEATLRRSYPKASPEDLQLEARNILTDEQVNRLLFAWLDQRRNDTKITFHEEGLA